jgi:hypothetical protein
LFEVIDQSLKATMLFIQAVYGRRHCGANSSTYNPIQETHDKLRYPLMPEIDKRHPDSASGTEIQSAGVSLTATPLGNPPSLIVFAAVSAL